VLQTKVCQQTKAIETPEHVHWIPIMVRQITSPASDRICWPESHWHAFNWTDTCWHTDKRTGWLLLLLCQSDIQHSIQLPLHPPCHSLTQTDMAPYIVLVVICLVFTCRSWLY
jgi:hypothetical protein